MIRYHSHRERRSRLGQQENIRLFKQTALIILVVLALLASLIFLGIPALIKLAVFLGDLRNSASPIETTDTIPPATPQFNPIPSATSSATLNLTGYSEPGANITLYQNGNQISTTLVDDQGVFTFPQVNLEPGLNRFYAIAQDIAKNDSLQSATQTTVLDNSLPTLTIQSPSDGQQFIGLNEQTINIQGTTDSDVSITLNDRLLVVNSDGNFNSRYSLQEGDNILKFTAIDTAGNSIQTQLTVNYSK
jgi:hypothetical protein